MLLHRELLVLIIAAFAASSTAEHNLRGSGDVANLIAEEETSSALVDEEERQLKPATAGGGGGGKGKNEETTATTTVPPSDGGAEAPPSGGGDDTTAPTTETVCNSACGDNEVCARKSPGVAAQCYPKCSGFPTNRDTCEGADVCVHSTFECGGYASVFNEFCQCNSLTDSYQDNCLASDCGLFVRK